MGRVVQYVERTKPKTNGNKPSAVDILRKTSLLSPYWTEIVVIFHSHRPPVEISFVKLDSS